MEASEYGDTKIFTRRTGGDKPCLSPPVNLALGEVHIKALQFHCTSDVILIRGKSSQLLSGELHASL